MLVISQDPYHPGVVAKQEGQEAPLLGAYMGDHLPVEVLQEAGGGPRARLGAAAGNGPQAARLLPPIEVMAAKAGQIGRVAYGNSPFAKTGTVPDPR